MVKNLIEQRCTELGITQKWLSEKSEVAESTISEIKSGKRIPGVDIAINLAKALSCTVEELFIPDD